MIKSSQSTTEYITKSVLKNQDKKITIIKGGK
jgi:hypothetical protein